MTLGLMLQTNKETNWTLFTFRATSFTLDHMQTQITMFSAPMTMFGNSEMISTWEHILLQMKLEMLGLLNMLVETNTLLAQQLTKISIYSLLMTDLTSMVMTLTLELTHIKRKEINGLLITSFVEISRIFIIIHIFDSMLNLFFYLKWTNYLK